MRFLRHRHVDTVFAGGGHRRSPHSDHLLQRSTKHLLLFFVGNLGSLQLRNHYHLHPPAHPKASCLCQTICHCLHGLYSIACSLGCRSGPLDTSPVLIDYFLPTISLFLLWSLPRITENFSSSYQRQNRMTSRRQPFE